MELNQKKHLTFAIVIVAILLAGALAYYFYARQSADKPNDGRLSEQEKQAILMELAKESANTTPIPEAQKQAILKELSASASAQQSTPLTEAEKAQILTELSGGTQ